jgi:hypothetical protein
MSGRFQADIEERSSVELRASRSGWRARLQRPSTDDAGRAIALDAIELIDQVLEARARGDRPELEGATQAGFEFSIPFARTRSMLIQELECDARPAHDPDDDELF